MKIAVIDDEQDAIDYLVDIIQEHIEGTSVIRTASSFQEALTLLKSDNFDLVLTDIKMPHGTGFDIIKSIDQPKFKVVFTTAYDEYALKAFKYNALDYLLKPIDPDELIEVFERVKASAQPEISDVLTNIQTLSKIAIPYKSGFVFVDLDDLVYLEADGSYTKVFTKNQNYIISKRLNQMEAILDERLFCRIHASYIINLKHLKIFTKMNGGEVELHGGIKLSVSKSRRAELMRILTR